MSGLLILSHGEEAGNSEPRDIEDSRDDDMPNSDSPDEVSDGGRKDFDKTKTHWPLFCTVEPTEAYWNKLRNQLEQGGISWVEICSKSWHRDEVVSDIEASIENEEKSPQPFIGYTMKELYEFWGRHIRPADDSTITETFTNYTFLVVDEGCMDFEREESEPGDNLALVKVCCDAPDYSDETRGGTRYVDETNGALLKWFWIPPIAATRLLYPLEQLTMTCSEVHDVEEAEIFPVDDALCSEPPFTQKQAPGQPENDYVPAEGEYVPATPAEARKAKERALSLRPKHRGQRVWDAERGAVLFRTSVRHAIRVAHINKQMDDLAKERGAVLTSRPNPAHAADEVYEMSLRDYIMANRTKNGYPSPEDNDETMPLHLRPH